MIFAAWKSGCRISADAQKVADEILAIGKSATTAQILDKARDEKTELHKCFDWNDAEAAEKWRMPPETWSSYWICYLPTPSMLWTPLTWSSAQSFLP